LCKSSGIKENGNSYLLLLLSCLIRKTHKLDFELFSLEICSIEELFEELVE